MSTSSFLEEIWNLPADFTSAERNDFNAHNWSATPTYQLPNGDYVRMLTSFNTPPEYMADGSVKFNVDADRVKWEQMAIANNDRKQEFANHDWRVMRWRWEYEFEAEVFFPTDWDGWWLLNPPSGGFTCVLFGGIFAGIKGDMAAAAGSGRTSWFWADRYHAVDDGLGGTPGTSHDSTLGGQGAVRGSKIIDGAAGMLGRFVPVVVRMIQHPLLPKGSFTVWVDGSIVAAVSSVRLGWYQEGEVSDSISPQWYTDRWLTNLSDTPIDTHIFWRDLTVRANPAPGGNFATPLSYFPNTPDYFRVDIGSATGYSSFWASRRWAIGQSMADPSQYGCIAYKSSNPNDFVRTKIYDHGDSSTALGGIFLSFGTPSSYTELELEIYIEGSLMARYEPISGLPTLPFSAPLTLLKTAGLAAWPSSITISYPLEI